MIEEHRPLSKTKRWRLREIIERVDVVAPDDAPTEISQQDVTIGEGQ